MAIQINFANDIGFSAVKGLISANGEKLQPVFIPSIRKRVNNSQNSTIRNNNDVSRPETIKKFMSGNIFNHMAVHFEEPALTNAITSNFFIGASANSSKGHTFKPSEVKFGNKGEASLSHQLTYTIIAYKALEAYYNKNNCLPSANTPISTNVNMIIALPEAEAKQPNSQQLCAKSYKDNKVHTVQLLNFSNGGAEYNITVNIKVNHIGVGIEGAVASQEITPNNKPLLAYFKKQYGKNLPKNDTDNSVMDTSNAYFMDFGEVTSDFVLMENGVFQPALSSSHNIGCHNILNGAVNLLNNETKKGPNSMFQCVYPGIHIQNLLSFLYRVRYVKKQGKSLSDPDKRELSDVQTALKENYKDVAEDLYPVIYNVLSNPDAISIYNKIIVFGGGSIALSNYGFQDVLRKMVHEIKPGVPVLFVDKNEAQTINVNGMKDTLLNLLKK